MMKKLPQKHENTKSSLPSNALRWVVSDALRPLNYMRWTRSVRAIPTAERREQGNYFAYFLK
jgi:hypothetical protein